MRIGVSEVVGMPGGMGPVGATGEHGVPDVDTNEALDDAFVRQMLAEEAKQVGVINSPAGNDSSPLTVKDAYEKIESEMKEHCTITIMLEVKRNLQLTYQPGRGILIGNANWSQMPELVLAKCLPALKRMPKEMAKHMKGHEATRVRAQASAVIASVVKDPPEKKDTKPPKHLEGKLPKSLDRKVASTSDND